MPWAAASNERPYLEKADEVAELEAYVGRRGVLARTLARAWILARLREETGDQHDLRARVARLEEAVFRRSA
jgi:hypothetical protein